MRKALTIAGRDFLAAVQSRYFQISVLIVPMLMVGSGLMGRNLAKDRNTRDKTYAVIDRTPDQRFLPVVKAAVIIRNQTELKDPETGAQSKPRYIIEAVEPGADTPEAVAQQRLELSQRVRDEKLDGFLEIGVDVGHPDTDARSPRSGLRFQSEGVSADARLDSFPRVAQRAVFAELMRKRFDKAGLSVEQVQKILTPVHLHARSLSHLDEETGEISEERKESVLARYGTMMALVMLMYMGILLCASFLIQGVLEEKMQRVAEVLLGSVRPFELMLGKLLGLGAVAFVMVGIYSTALYWAARWLDWGDYLPPLELLPWFLVFFVLGILMYGSVALALGAASTDLKEVNVLFTPVALVAAMPLMLLPFVQDSPNGAMALAFSFFPPTTPTFMIARMALPNGIPWWQPIVAAVLLVATTIACVWAAGRVFRVGILVQGKGARLHEIFQWILRG